MRSIVALILMCLHPQDGRRFQAAIPFKKYRTFVLMIKYLKQAEIDYDKWDDCISNAMNSYVYAYSWYLDIVAGEWDALVQGDYKRVFPLPFRKKYGIKYIYQPAFSQQLGLFSKAPIENKSLEAFLSAIPKEFKLVELNLNKYYIPNEGKGIKLKKNRNIELDLNFDYQQLAVDYSSNLKRNIKKAKKNNLQIIKNTKPEELIKLFKENKGQEVKAYSEMDYTHLNRLIYLLVHKGMGEVISVASSENNLIASALFVRDAHRHIFLFSGLSKEGKQKAAMPFLIDSYIQEHSNTAMILDFEGSNNENLARFYRSFGAADYSYYSIRMLGGNSLTRAIISAKDALRSQ